MILIIILKWDVLVPSKNLRNLKPPLKLMVLLALGLLHRNQQERKSIRSSLILSYKGDKSLTD